MRISLPVGVLAGLAEVAWSYLLPIFSDAWRAVLPTTAAGLLQFIAAAVATDALLALVGGCVLAGLMWLLVKVTRAKAESSWLRTTAGTLLLGSAACYLYLGWIMLFVLLPGERGTVGYQLVVWGGAAVLVVASLLVVVLLNRAGRRRWRGAPLATWCGAAAVLVLAAMPGFGRQRALAVGGPAIAPTPGRPRSNVVLVTLDTLRVDYLGCYGHPWIRTPVCDALAADGVAFDQAIAQAPSTAPSHASIFTSVYPFDHGTENGKPMVRGLVTLADVLRANGYETAAFTSSTTTRSINSGLQQGFDTYDDSLVAWSSLFARDEFQQLIFLYLIGIAHHSQVRGEVVSDRAIRWLDQRRTDRPFFAWLHYFDPHTPYGSPPPFRGTYAGKAADGLPMAADRERYAEDVSYADHQLGRFLGALRQRGLYDDTLILVASDHGEAFGEMHDGVSETRHGRYLYDTTQRVPLIVKPAGTRGMARRAGEQVELVDLAPTVLSLLRIDIPAQFVGKPLDELLDGRPFSYAARDAHAFNVIDVAASAGAGASGRALEPKAGQPVMFVQQLAVRTPQWKYITIPRVPRAELYDLVSDPHERRNQARSQRELTADLHARVTRFWDPAKDVNRDPRQRLAPSLLKQLQGLGYLGGEENAPENEGSQP